MQVEAYMVTSSWEENTITWNTRANCDDEKLTVVNVGRGYNESATSVTWRYCDFYITQAVMAWLQNSDLNHGIVLKSRLESWGGINARRFYSRESSVIPPHLSITYTADLISMDNIGIENNSQYYIKNKNSGLYLTSTGYSGYYYATQVPWSGANSQKWTVQCDSDGYYKLIPQNATNQVLSVCDNDDNDRKGIELAYPNSSTGQQFKFVRNWDGSYQILTRESDFTKGLRVEEDDTAIGAYIGHLEHTVDWTKSDDWTLEAVHKGDANVYSFVYDDLDTTEFVGPMLTSLAGMGYDEFDCRNHSAELGYYWLSTDSIWIFSGHGGGGSLSFVEHTDEEGELVGSYITATSAYEDCFPVSEKPHNDLAQLQLALFASCQTGLDETDYYGNSIDSNLVGLMYRKGTHFTIANTDVTYTPWADIWVQRFLNYCKEGETIYEAMCSADDDLYSGLYIDVNEYLDVYDYETLFATYGNAIQRHTLGDNSLVLYHGE